MAIFLPLPGNEALAERLAALTGGTVCKMEARRFPDGESYVRIHSEVRGADAVLVCSLARPDEKLLPLLFAAATARRLGCRSVRLVAPYLAYMRQDAIFQPGEAITSRDFAALLSHALDGLVTVDPHLHRYKALSEIYSCEAKVVHAAPLLGRWIRERVERPLVVGPDEESEQWAAEIAAAAAAPHVVFRKRRLGDRSVQLSLPGLEQWRDHRPVLVDDIVASGATVAEAAASLHEAGLGRPWCLAIHGLFDADAGERLRQVTEGLVITDSVPGPESRIGVAELIAAAL